MSSAPKDLPKAAAALLEEVLVFERGARARHEHHRRRWERYYKLYRSYRELKRQYGAAKSARDVDDVMREARTGFGADLFIPLVFSIVETTLPRMLSQNPKLLVTPADPKSEANVDNIELVVNRQQSSTAFDLESQMVCKSGLVYGIGVGKTYWDKDSVMAPEIVEAIAPATGQPTWVEGPDVETIRYEGPRMEAVDIFDWIWDPDAHNMRTLERCIHRTWRSTSYVKRMFDSGAWKMPRGWTMDDVCGRDGRARYDEVWDQRGSASGMPSLSDDKPREIHEVWEYWCYDKVVVVLNRVCPVASGKQPYWHREIPFQIFRPTQVMHEMCGIGEVEAVEDLQEEMNTMRSQRRDNATLVLQRPFAYFDGYVNPEDIEFGAGKMWPVEGPPGELLFPIPLQDIPFSSYKEEEALKADIDRTSGISDSVAGGDGGQETATGTQLVHAAAGVRIQNKTKLFERETIAKCCYQWVRLDQQHIVTEQDFMGPPKPGDGRREYSWYRVGPAELAGTFLVECDGGSMSPQNEVEKKQRAQEVLLALTPFMGAIVDPRKITTWVMEQFGFKNPDAYLMPEMPDVPFAALDLVRDELAQSRGIDPNEFEALVEEAIRIVEQGAQDPTFASTGDQQPQGRQVGAGAGPPPQQQAALPAGTPG